MNVAFEVTPEDLLSVLEKHNIPMELDSPELDAMFKKHIAPPYVRIERAALYGNDIDEQTDFAREEIETILIEKGIIQKKS